MNLPLVITLNAILGLAAVLAVFAVVRFTHRLHAHDAKTIPLGIGLPAEAVEELAEAA